jgi:choloylglycine hydrolase
VIDSKIARIAEKRTGRPGAKLFLPLFSIALSLSLNSAPANACTDFMVKAADGTAVVGRSMEWGLDLKSNIWSTPRGETRSSTSPDGKTGVHWTSKYGYLSLDCNNMPLAIDGMNEKGLSMGLLWLPGTVYQDVPKDHPETAMSLLDLGHWLLGSFSTVDEAKAALAKVQVWSPALADWGGKPTAHLAIHDAAGNSAVIEFIDGQQKVYDNPGRVLTNAPTFDWQRTNLRNYISLSPQSDHAITIKGTVLAPPGQGGGFLGIPGDWTPPSRFVRTSAMLAFAEPARNATEAVVLTTHILNAVDIPLGDIREKTGEVEHCDYTQWVVLKDLKNRILYFRSYDNSALKSIDMSKLDFAAGKPRQLTAVAGGKLSVDVTPQ